VDFFLAKYFEYVFPTVKDDTAEVEVLHVGTNADADIIELFKVSAEAAAIPETMPRDLYRFLI